MSEKRRLTIHYAGNISPRSDVSVRHATYGTPIPFEWIDYETIEIDEAFAEAAQVVFEPSPKDRDDGAGS